MNNLRKRNREQGKLNEKNVLAFLNRKNNPNDYWIDNNKKDDSSVIDFSHCNKKLQIELKSRNYNFSDLPDWQIGKNKIETMIDDKVNTSFIFFLFYDGLYMWKYNLPNLINHCECKEGGTIKRGINEITPDNIYIKREYLKFITKNVVNVPIVDEDDGCLL